MIAPDTWNIEQENAVLLEVDGRRNDLLPRQLIGRGDRLEGADQSKRQ